MMLHTTVYAAARSRAHGPTAALWHAVELHRPPGEVDGACELTVCGSLARVSTEDRWPIAASDVCTVCVAVARALSPDALPSGGGGSAPTAGARVRCGRPARADAALPPAEAVRSLLLGEFGAEPGQEVGAGARAQPLPHPGHVVFHGLRGDEQLSADLAIRLPGDHQPGHLSFSLAQRAGRHRNGLCAVGAGGRHSGPRLPVVGLARRPGAEQQ